MHHRKKSLALLVAATIFIVAGYILLYVTPAEKLGSCAKLGGTCKIDCSLGERRIGSCGEMSCCIPLTSSIVAPKFTEAVSKRDISICALLTPDLKKQCEILVFDSISSDLALKYNDISHCDEIIDEGIRDSCIQQIAFKSGDKSLCSGIESESAFDKCIMHFALKARDWQICANEIVRKIDVDLCLKQIAVALKSIDICSQMSLEPEKADCLLRVELALNSENNVDCSIIGRENCESTKGCRQVLVTDPLEELKDVYAGCARDARYFCESTNGKWIVEDEFLEISETCNCGNRAYYAGYGCFDCAGFTYSKADCLRRLQRNS
ncbi:MAG: hypothetical protein PHO02_02235 [Candidatus Nanoarchaeia archaeon]|nr:hypothetical protein [Candidatus Nanoarchaeia archaeon]